jgi:peptide-methionine (S)-S-oxide reductase
VFEMNQKATFGAGCFWHVELEFSKILGVIKTEVGYMGGQTKNPTYEQVCTDKTGHVEIVQITFNQKEVSYKRLLDKFWNSHDPTQLNRQGPDIGTQYKSIIFYHNDEQKQIAQESLKKEQEKYSKENKTIATRIEPAKTFYKAEEYHQKYLEKKGKNTC